MHFQILKRPSLELNPMLVWTLLLVSVVVICVSASVVSLGCLICWPQSVLGLVAPRRVVFSLSRVGFVFGCVCGGLVL